MVVFFYIIQMSIYLSNCTSVENTMNKKNWRVCCNTQLWLNIKDRLQKWSAFMTNVFLRVLKFPTALDNYEQNPIKSANSVL